MRVDSSNQAKESRKKLYAGLAVAAIFVLALFLRTYWNVDVAHDGTSFVLSAGSDPYYHKRAIDYIQESGWTTLISDPMLNFPYGAVNPNPPLFQWSVAVMGAILAPFFSAQGDLSSMEVATWWAMEWSPAIWGALTVVPVYFLGAALFSRRAGLIGAFLYGVSTTALEHTSLGAADHDAMILFFTALAFFFFTRTLQTLRGEESWVTDYRNKDDVLAGIRRIFTERTQAIAFAALTGVSIGAVALIWKGFPYLVGVIFAYAALQFVVDHWRSRDSLGLFVTTTLALVLGIVLAMPYYAAADVLNFLSPAWYIVGAFVAFGLVMVPTRDLPTILVMPVFAGVAAILALIAFFVVPDVARSLLYATVYFKQTSVYQTIAEAQPASFNTMVFSIGPVPFFLALAGIALLAIRTWKEPQRAKLFALVWAVLALYMAASAVRFLFNATPILAVLGGWVTALFVDWLDFPSIRKNAQKARARFGGVTGRQVTGAIALALLLVFPSVFMAVDAAIPPSAERRMVSDEDGFMGEFVQKRFGAFGQDFIPAYWREGLSGWLSEQDEDLPPAERPGFLSWWDYGHWAIYEGKHPAVADNFQNGYVYAANFLLSQNETQAIQLLAARYTDYFEADRYESTTGDLLTKEDYLQLLAEAGVPEDRLEETFAQLDAFEYAPALDLQSAQKLTALIEETTGKSIRYVAVDYRLMPLDDPGTGSIDFASIFYAPVVLAEKEQSDFVEARIQTSQFDQRGLSVEEWEERIRNPYAQPPQAIGEFYAYKPAFFNTMLYKTYVGTPPMASFENGFVRGDAVLQAALVPQPGYGLEHFRLAYANENVGTINGLSILEYYHGAVVRGQVLEDGEGRAATRVTVYDDAGNILYEHFKDRLNEGTTADQLNIPHASNVTNDAGEYELLAPYGTVTIVASDGNVEIGRTTLEITKEEANTGAVFEGVDVEVTAGGVEGLAFYDANANGVFDEDTDTPVSDLPVRIGSQNATTDAEGRYSLGGVSPGRRAVSIESDEYQLANGATVAVESGETTTHNLVLALKTVEVSGAAFVDRNANGELDEDEALDGVRIPITPDADVEDNTAKAPTAPVIAEGGNYTVELAPGTYVLGEFTDPDTNVTYAPQDSTLVVGRGAEFMTRDIVYVARTE